jgi:hypothetical protein
MNELLILGELVLICSLMTLIRNKKKSSILSPVYVFLLTYGLVYICGWIAWPLDYSMGGVSAFIEIDSVQALEALRDGLSIMVFFVIGVVLHTLRGPTRVSVAYQLGKSSLFHDKKIALSTCVLVFTLAILSLLLNMLGAGFGSLWDRKLYIPVSILEAKILGNVTAPLALISIGFIHARMGVIGKLFAVLMLSAFFITYFSLASRWLAITFLLFSLGLYSAAPNARFSKLAVLCSLVGVFILLPLPLALRSMPSQGLNPFLGYMLTDGYLVAKLEYGKLVNNVLFAFPLSAYVSSLPKLSYSDFLVSINPLPGSMIGWYELVVLLRLNPYTPFNTTGQLLNHGLVITAGYYSILGMYFSRLDYKIIEFVNKGNVILSAVLLGMSFLYILTTLQYNLRSSTRLIYYMMFIELLFSYVVPRVFGLRKRRNREAIF